MADKKPKSEPKGPGRPRTEAPVLPIYDSMQACHAAIGIPLGTLKLAKKAGCIAFRSNRVDLAELLKWIFAHDEADGGIDWGTELTKEKAKREKIRRLKDEGSVVERAAVREGTLQGMSILFSELDRIFLAEFPPAVKGKKEPEIRAMSEESISTLRETLREKFTAIGSEEANSDEEEEAA